ncbi:MBL fold metallo-hydrolase [Thiomicrorhabdus aquaedulcis]|uniref:MBL fold metallo-hydrolase n=1 Tax=Thiomicrorhabdus aquaedulcis TaxID=2211106 RepID=UPI000FD9136E|nr:MBL fold metallo-hydrolase [Thiomicrorhabdus aquaedulcis]
MTIIGLPALVGSYDNLIWILYHQDKAWVIDPGESSQVIDFLQQHSLNLHGILITHDHQDHTHGVSELLKHCPESNIYGPKNSPLSAYYPQYKALQEKDSITLYPGYTLNVLDTPGHTPNHISFLIMKFCFVGILYLAQAQENF